MSDSYWMDLFMFGFPSFARLRPFSTSNDCWRKSVCLAVYSTNPEVTPILISLVQFLQLQHCCAVHRSVKKRQRLQIGKQSQFLQCYCYPCSQFLHLISSTLPFGLFCLFVFALIRITLNTLTLNVKSDKVYTRHGVPISVTGIAQVCFENLFQNLKLQRIGNIQMSHGTKLPLKSTLTKRIMKILHIIFKSTLNLIHFFCSFKFVLLSAHTSMRK